MGINRPPEGRSRKSLAARLVLPQISATMSAPKPTVMVSIMGGSGWVVAGSQKEQWLCAVALPLNDVPPATAKCTAKAKATAIFLAFVGRPSRRALGGVQRCHAVRYPSA
jgi:hypothetical protein